MVLTAIELSGIRSSSGSKNPFRGGKRKCYYYYYLTTHSTHFYYDYIASDIAEIELGRCSIYTVAVADP